MDCSLGMVGKIYNKDSQYGRREGLQGEGRLNPTKSWILTDGKGQPKRGEKEMNWQKHLPINADSAPEGILESLQKGRTQAWA